MSDFEPHYTRDGGYVEPNRLKAWIQWFAKDVPEELEVTSGPVVAEIKVSDSHH